MSRAKATSQPSWLRRHGVTVALLGVLAVGLGLLAYPSVSNYWNSLHQSRVVMNYNDVVSNMDATQYQSYLDAAEAYNERLSQTGQLWNMTEAQEDEYDSLLNVDGTGVMGYIDIPKIDVELPIYHGTDDAVLQTSIGHLAGTSLPVGGAGSHCVLSGHRGLPSARLFTDLDKLTEGDTFSITVLNETLTYEVDQVRIVEPNDLSDLQIEPGQDYCTLVTCTPYGINTQRLLVRGHRVANPDGDAQVLAEAVQIRPVYIAPFVAVPLVAVLVLYTFAMGRRRGRKADVEGAYLEERGLARPRPEWMDDDDPGPTLTEALRSLLRRGRHGTRGAGAHGAHTGPGAQADDRTAADRHKDAESDATRHSGVEGGRHAKQK